MNSLTASIFDSASIDNTTFRESKLSQYSKSKDFNSFTAYTIRDPNNKTSTTVRDIEVQ